VIVLKNKEIYIGVGILTITIGGTLVYYLLTHEKKTSKKPERTLPLGHSTLELTANYRINGKTKPIPDAKVTITDCEGRYYYNYTNRIGVSRLINLPSGYFPNCPLTISVRKEGFHPSVVYEYTYLEPNTTTIRSYTLIPER